MDLTRVHMALLHPKTGERPCEGHIGKGQIRIRIRVRIRGSASCEGDIVELASHFVRLHGPHGVVQGSQMNLKRKRVRYGPYTDPCTDPYTDPECVTSKATESFLSLTRFPFSGCITGGNFFLVSSARYSELDKIRVRIRSVYGRLLFMTPFGRCHLPPLSRGGLPSHLILRDLKLDGVRLG